MKGSDISDFFCGPQSADVGKFFQNVYSFDTFPRQLESAKFIIVNTNLSTAPMSQVGHWFSIARPNERAIYELFDPLGSSQDFVASLKLEAKVAKFNRSPVQDTRSSLCGEMVCYFNTFRWINQDLPFVDCVNQTFYAGSVDKLKLNDKLVLDFMATGEFREI